jgi:hypothetical protein
MCGGTSGERTATGGAVVGVGFRRSQRNRLLSGQVDALCHTTVAATWPPSTASWAKSQQAVAQSVNGVLVETAVPAVWRPSPRTARAGRHRRDNRANYETASSGTSPRPDQIQVACTLSSTPPLRPRPLHHQRRPGLRPQQRAPPSVPHPVPVTRMPPLVADPGQRRPGAAVLGVGLQFASSR